MNSIRSNQEQPKTGHNCPILVWQSNPDSRRNPVAIFIPACNVLRFMTQLQKIINVSSFNDAVSSAHLIIKNNDHGLYVDFSNQSGHEDGEKLAVALVGCIQKIEMLNVPNRDAVYIVSNEGYQKISSYDTLKIMVNILTNYKNMLPTFLGMDTEFDKAIALVMKE